MSDAIKRLIHHEKQEKGSMLCAQHALNAVLQGPYFTATDLAEIARELDQIESEHRAQDVQPTESMNMDDSGFFSVQVLDRALIVWGLTLVRWRSQDLAQFHDDPDTQQAFVLNLNSHWFTLRRFGSPGGNGHWFNLNSFYDAPERIGKMYLGMVIQQAEAEGYSVFAIRPLPGAETAVPPSEADEVASTIPDDGHEGFGSGSRSGAATTGATGVEGFDDDDEEFQRALEMSLRDHTGGGGESSGAAQIQQPQTSFLQPTTTASASSSAPSSRPFSSLSSLAPGPGVGVSMPGAFTFDSAPGSSGSHSPMGSAHDSVEASMARSRALLEQAQREQRMAEQAGGFRRRGGEEDEEEEMRRAIEESLRGHAAPAGEDEDDGDGDGEYVMDEDDEEVDPEADTSYLPPSRRPAVPSSLPQSQSRTLPNNLPQPRDRDRVIDDEDAELQAALKASLEGLPEDFVPPSPPPRRLPVVHSSGSDLPPQTPAGSNRYSEGVNRRDEDDSDEDDDLEEEGREKTPEPEQAPSVDVDEMRRRRLARFGGP